MPTRYTVPASVARREILESAAHPMISNNGEIVAEEVAEAWAMGFLDLAGPLAYFDRDAACWSGVEVSK